MTPKEIVLSGYQCFAEGDMEGLGKIYHPNALIKVNGDHELSGDYHGFDDFLNNFLAKIPIKFPNFDLDILNVTAEDNRVHVHVKLSADNLESEAVHMFVVEDGLETEFRIVDDSQKIAKALGG
ncbi:nuclear transport factor 2 family protein [Rhodospirillales bacterium]|jgi:ketosteroid isomerase-like protein|nr:nuclear transport factor 2 family protein [Rhodospirillales bacterium]